jgi:ribosomal protein S18 acetylase RimI-like enzyme
MPLICIHLNAEFGSSALAFYGLSPRIQQYKVVRLMIDQRYQGQGLRRAAMEAMIRDLVATSDAQELWLSYREWNTQARRLYQSLGFQERTIEPHGRITASLILDRYTDAEKLS